MFKRILIANRGEIALRVIRACRDLGVETVAVFSAADRAAMHVRAADLAMEIGPPPAAESYLNTTRIIDAAHRAGAEAIHPGYGFLSENEAFADAVIKSGLVFIGPRPDAIGKMGDKVRARELMAAADVPIVPGSDGTVGDEREVREIVERVGLPVILKAAGGGGGKGMRLIEEQKDLAGAVRAVVSEARSSFGDGRFYVEKFVPRPRHIEFQVMADAAGDTVHLFERECSIQRRNQKVIEESPSPFMTPELRRAMGQVAVKAAQAVSYLGAGTIEFLVDPDRNFYFLEMNTRIQVEHPITELVCGVDLVKTQIEIAAGGRLPYKQETLTQNGWAIECRVYAEDPARNFAPAPGRIESFRLPEGPGVRNDCGVSQGMEISTYYDPMIGKLAVWGADRTQAAQRMRRALAEYEIGGTLRTNLEFHRWLLDHPDFVAGRYDTQFIRQHYHPADRPPSPPMELTAAAIAAALSVTRNDNAAAQAAAPARASAWKTAGRIAAMRDR